jgi:hypothetical protein
MQCRTKCAADAAAGGGVTAAQAYLLRGGRRLVAGGGPGAELRRPRLLATLTQPFATRRESRRAPSMIKSAHGQSRRANFVSSLRKDCCREVDTCTTSRRAPGDPAHQRGSLDVRSVFRRVEDHRRLRTLFGAASGCDGTAPCRYLAARPFGCAGFPGKHRQQSQLDAFVDCSG